MRDGRVFVRTIAGLKRADVLWRHVDAEWCDPLELNSSSRIGVPGLLEAIRAGRRRGREHARARASSNRARCSPSCPRSPGG